MNFELIIWVTLPALMALFGLTMFIAARFEKQPVPSLVPLTEGEVPQPSAYLSTVEEAAQELGFYPYEMRRHAKGGRYRVYAGLWLSPSQQTMALVGAGKLAGMKVRKTVLYSRLVDGRYVLSADEFSEGELCDLCSSEVLVNADLYELVDFHERRLAEFDTPVIPFPPTDGWEAHAELETQRVRRLVETGDAEFVDPAETNWRYTIKASLKLVWHWQSKMSAVRKHGQRAKIKRPGHPRYVPSIARSDGPALIVSPLGSEPGTARPIFAEQPLFTADGATPNQEFLHQPQDVLKRSGCGVASFVLALLMGMAELIAAVVIASADEESNTAAAAALVMLLGLTGALVGVALGIVGVAQGGRKKVLAIVGLVLNGLLLLVAVGLVVLGAFVA